MGLTMRLRTLLARGCRLRCPACGQGRLFVSWVRMPKRCDHCKFQFERGPGYFLGSIYINYGATAVIVMLMFLVLFLGVGIDPDRLIWPLFGFCLLFPVLFFRHARSLWLAMDQFFDPVQETKKSDDVD